MPVFGIENPTRYWWGFFFYTWVSYEYKKQFTKARQQANHLACVNTRDKTKEEIAHIDERFFLAMEKMERLKDGCRPVQSSNPKEAIKKGTKSKAIT